MCNSNPHNSNMDKNKFFQEWKKEQACNVLKYIKPKDTDPPPLERKLEALFDKQSGKMSADNQTALTAYFDQPQQHKQLTLGEVKQKLGTWDPSNPLAVVSIKHPVE